jgi:hypothetical protein
MFFQAENDYDLSQSRTLSQEMKQVGKVSKLNWENCRGGSQLRASRQLGLGRRRVSFSGTAVT